MTTKTRRKFSEATKRAILAEAGKGVPVNAIIKKHRISNGQFYAWRKKLRKATKRRVREDDIMSVQTDAAGTPQPDNYVLSLQEENRTLRRGLGDQLVAQFLVGTK